MDVKYSKFPLYPNDSKACAGLSVSQKEWIIRLNKAIDNGSLKLEFNNCLCGNAHVDRDIIVSEKDRYGFSIKQILCSHCGLIRSGQVFDYKSNIEFYKTYYRPIYSSEEVTDRFFERQIKKGIGFLNLISRHISLEDIENVVEIGCGAGGILVPFKNKGKKIDGYDYGQEYLNFGISKGLNLHCGDYEQIPEDSVDLIILSHVMEHFLDPLEEMKQIIGKVKASKYLLIEVPGIFKIADVYFNPITYFQNAHVYNYFSDYLKVFYESLGLKVLYGDENCTFICQKSENSDFENGNSFVWNTFLESYPEKIADYLIFCKKKYKRRVLNPKWLKHFSWILMNKLGWQKIRPYVLKK